jgi:FtsH-binding integral membrane protein
MAGARRIKMNEMKQPTQNREEGVTRTAFWGTIALAGIDVSICSYLFVALYQQPRTPIMYTVMAVFLLAILTALTSFVLTLSRRQELAAKLLFCVIFVIGISAVTLFQGRTLDASLSILFIILRVFRCGVCFDVGDRVDQSILANTI